MSWRLAGTSFAKAAIASVGYYSEHFGTGADGALVFDGVATVLGMVPAGNVYTLTRDIAPSDMTIAAGVAIVTANYYIQIAGTLTNNGTIRNNGNNGTNAGGGTANLVRRFPATLAGGFAGGAPVNSTTIPWPYFTPGAGGAAGGQFGGAGGAGGAGTGAGGGGGGGNSAGAGGQGGAGGLTNTSGIGGGTSFVLDWVSIISGLRVQGAAGAQSFNLGAGGGYGNTSGTGSGGGGAGGGACVIAARVIAGSGGAIQARGGAGAASSGVDSGGGGGGGGGLVALLYTTMSGQTVDANGGLGGAAGGGVSGHGGNGGSGAVLKFNISGDGT